MRLCGRKTPLPFPCFAAVTCRQSAPCPLRKWVIHKRVETLVSTLLCARAASAQISFASQAITHKISTDFAKDAKKGASGHADLPSQTARPTAALRAALPCCPRGHHVRCLARRHAPAEQTPAGGQSARQPDHRGNRLRSACRRRLHRLCAKARLLCAGAACCAGFRAAGVARTDFAVDFRL